jgi:hypothetical protein
MIITGILNIIYGAVFLVLLPFRLLPNATLPPEILGAIGQAGTYFRAFDYFIPTTTFLACLGAVLALEAGIFGYKIVNWIIKKIPFIN